MSLPLQGLTIVSIEQAVSAPFATRQLADLGSTASNDVGRSQRCDEPLQLHIAGQV